MVAEQLSDVIVARLLKEMEGYYELGLHEEVVERADRLLAAAREPARAHEYRARALQDSGRLEEAIESYEELRRIAPEEDSADFGLGWCYKRTDRLDLSIATLEALLARAPDNPLCVYNLACYLALAGEHERSLELLARAIDLDPRFRDHAETETDFDGVRDDPEFARILAG